DESTSQDQASAEADALAAWQAIPYSVSHEEAQRIPQEYLDKARREFEEQISRLPQADQDAVRQIEMQLNADDGRVYVNTRWWGFEIVLDAVAARAAERISARVGRVAKAFLPMPIGRLVELSFRIRALIIRNVGRDHGCRLVSPGSPRGCSSPSLWPPGRTPRCGGRP
ncbi:hypothetical protein AB0J63_47180, partial [Streptosporangium canum]|uniref:hypothetical protein n=1 Tax=Streptosporangium canum TaxID=324952 RepID=UPI0034308206